MSKPKRSYNIVADSEEEIAKINYASLAVHYLWDTDPDADPDQMAAYCDYMQGFTEAPRRATLSDSREDEVTCLLCLGYIYQRDHADDA